MNMSYKIAIASADGENINLSFGAAEFFYIYEAEGTAFHFLEKRKYEQNEEESDELSNHQLKESSGNCGSKKKLHVAVAVGKYLQKSECWETADVFCAGRLALMSQNSLTKWQ